LPKSLLNACSKIAVILKQNDTYLSCTPQLSKSGPMASLLPAVQEQLGLSFVPMEFVPDERPSSEQLSKLTSTRKVASARHLVRLADLCLCALWCASWTAHSTSIHSTCARCNCCISIQHGICARVMLCAILQHGNDVLQNS